MRNTRTVLYALGLLVGGGTALVTPTSGCIVPDYCIVLYSKGKNWCASMLGAQKWPVGQPELAEAVLSDHYEVPTGCICVNETEDAILSLKAPYDAYLLLREDIVAAAREDCLVLAEGFANDCLVEGVGAPEVGEEDPNDDKTGPCVGGCKYIHPPPNKDCPDDPNPFECEEIIEGSNDEADDGTCPIGAQACPCTAGGACDEGLMCLDGMCVPAADTGDDQGDVSPLEIDERIE